MLIQLTVENFKSIRTAQTIDFYAPLARNDYPDNTIVLEDDGLRVLRSVGLYGANAAGKSTVFHALYSIMDIIAWRDCLPDGNIPFYNPYRLSAETQSSPTKLSLEFALPLEDMAPFRRFLFSVSFNEKAITSEKLTAFGKKGKEHLLYARKEHDTAKTIKLGRMLIGGRRRIPFFANQAYLAAAWQTPDCPKMLRTIAGYLCVGIDIPGATKFGNVKPDEIATVALPYADVGISRAVAQKPSLDSDRIATMQKYLSQEAIDLLMSSFKDDSAVEYSFEHKGDAGARALFKLDEESDGTKRFFELLPKLLNAFDNGLTLLADEIDTHMHPYLVELVIRLFNDPEINRNNAQLVFSTHNMGLLSERFMRKDQIWFAEKNHGASEFFSLQDFDQKKVSSHSPFAQWYLEGRFGGVPNLDYQGFVNALKSLQGKGAANA